MNVKWTFVICLIADLYVSELQGRQLVGLQGLEDGGKASGGQARRFLGFGTVNIEEIVTFRFTSRENADTPQILRTNSTNELLKSRLELPLYVVSHGFREKGTEDRWTSVAEELKERLDVNVITVDWGGLARFPFYFSVARRVRLVGAYLGKLLSSLIAEGLDPAKIHLVGFSLGAHVVGFAAKSLKPITVARITGLDPALPGFERATSAGRLDKSDAQFVDVMHTNGGVYGFVEPLGHADFYVNGGLRQPSCMSFDFGVCSHGRAVDYFAESVDPTSRFPSERCSDIPETGHRAYLNNCTPTNYTMGLYLDSSARGIFLTETRNKAPFSPVRN